ncbi:MAG: glycosyltransferase family 4 protein [Rickettsiaceae bacterium]|nr:glycosyltransferase family 4 protein [Rickettsiaceae bacterium]
MNIPYANIIFFFVSAVVFSFFATSIAENLFRKLQIVDKPDNRRMHSIVTPKCGGVVFVLTIVFGLFISAYYGFIGLDECEYVSLALLVIAFVSFIDDINELPVVLRLVVHISVSAFVIYVILYPKPLFHYEVPEFVDYIFAVIGLTIFINIYNFMDGVDGLAAAQSLHLSITIIILTLLCYDFVIFPNLVLSLATLVLAASLGFISHNWHPAKIFLGDVGSISLGLIIGLCLMLLAASSQHLFIASVIASLYYIADGGGTILIRMIKLEKIWLPHLNHFFHQAVRKGLSHSQVSSRVALCNLILMFLAVGALYQPIIATLLAIVSVASTLVHFTGNRISHETNSR